MLYSLNQCAYTLLRVKLISHQGIKKGFISFGHFIMDGSCRPQNIAARQIQLIESLSLSSVFNWRPVLTRINRKEKAP
jgi:hypothetical protein